MGSSASAHGPLVLLTGATGYIGGRLLKALERAGTRVRCLARRPEFLEPRVAPGTEVVKGDCLDPSSLLPALAGVHTAFYLVHSMGSTGKFEEEDRQQFATSRRLRVRRAYAASSIWVASVPRNRSYPLTCGVVRKWQIFCGLPVFLP